MLEWARAKHRRALGGEMAKWRKIKTCFAVSEDGKSWRVIDWYGRYDTVKGWFDLRVQQPSNAPDIIDLPAPGLCFWKKAGGHGEPTTEEDIATMMIDLPLAYEAIGGTCRFSDERYVY
jgi:hypothetical protein